MTPFLATISLALSAFLLPGQSVPSLPLAIVREEEVLVGETSSDSPTLPLAESSREGPAHSRIVTITAYSSSVDETDSSPFITASNTRVRDGIIASNDLPFGSKVRIPKYFGDKIFIVEDRMNARYRNRVDIWFSAKSSALNFGLQTAAIEVLP